MADNMNSSGGQSKYGPGSPSSLEKLGVKGYVAKGTVGARPDASHNTYPGSGASGELFKGNKSNAPTSVNLNSGSGEKSSDNNAFYPGNSELGSVGERQNMTIPGKAGHNGTFQGGGKIPETSTAKQFGSLRVQDKEGFLRGTGRPIPKPAKSIGTKGGPGTGSKA